MPSPDEIQRIATAMNALRPDWKPSSLITFLTRHHAARSYRDLAIAAICVASDQRTETPKLLNDHGAWWVAAQAAQPGRASTVIPDSTTERCTVAGHEHELASNCRTCAAEPYNPTTAPTLGVLSDAQKAINLRGLAEARAALQATTTRAADHAERASGDGREGER